MVKSLGENGNPVADGADPSLGAVPVIDSWISVAAKTK